MENLFSGTEETNAFESLTESEPKKDSFKQDKPKKENYWDKTDIKPLEIDPSKFHKTWNAFCIYTNPAGDNVPPTAKENIIKLAKSLMALGWTFRHTGDDKDEVQNELLKVTDANIVSYLPWPKFNPLVKDCIRPTPEGYQVAAGVHKRYMTLPPSVRAILARDVNALVGKELTDPVDLVIAWNELGNENIPNMRGKSKDEINSIFKKIGNLTFIFQVGKRANIPVFNVQNSDVLERMKEYVGTVKKPNA